MLKSNATETKQPKSIAYIRVSSQRQVDEGVSLDAQKRRIEQLAEFKGLNLDPNDILIEHNWIWLIIIIIFFFRKIFSLIDWVVLLENSIFKQNPIIDFDYFSSCGLSIICGIVKFL